jgi:small subunit ribosomal protein S4
MARLLGPACRNCRRETVKLMLKGVRCETARCPMEREYRNNPPGMHMWRRGRSSEYAVRLREKQKVKRYYGVLERQFRRYFREAERAKGNTGKVLISLLERRLDNIVHRLGFGLSLAQARQIVRHGHILVNGKRVDIPSYQVRVGDVIAAKERPKSTQAVQASLGQSSRDVPDFLSRVDAPRPEGHVLRLPEAEDVSIPVQVQLIVELCSK